MSNIILKTLLPNLLPMVKPAVNDAEKNILKILNEAQQKLPENSEVIFALSKKNEKVVIMPLVLEQSNNQYTLNQEIDTGLKSNYFTKFILDLFNNAKKQL